MALSTGVAVECKNPECGTSWGVKLYRSGGASDCESCGGEHEALDDGRYWFVPDEGDS